MIYICGYVHLSNRCLYKYLHIWSYLRLACTCLLGILGAASCASSVGIWLRNAWFKGNNQILQITQIIIDWRRYKVLKKNETFHVISSMTCIIPVSKQTIWPCCKSRSDTKGPTSSSPCRRPVQIVGWVSTTNAIHQHRKSLRLCMRMAFFRSMWWVLNFGRCQSCT